MTASRSGLLVHLTPDEERRVKLCGGEAEKVFRLRLHEARIWLPDDLQRDLLAGAVPDIVNFLPTLKRMDDDGIKVVGASVGEQMAASVRAVLASRAPPSRVGPAN